MSMDDDRVIGLSIFHFWEQMKDFSTHGTASQFRIHSCVTQRSYQVIQALSFCEHQQVNIHGGSRWAPSGYSEATYKVRNRLYAHHREELSTGPKLD